MVIAFVFVPLCLLSAGQRRAARYKCQHADTEAVDDDEKQLLHPRSYATFYNTILAGCLIRQRPDTKYCPSCLKLPAVKEELTRLSIAISSTRNFSDWDDSEEKANARQKQLEADVVSLNQHEIWLKTQRKTVRCDLMLSVDNSVGKGVRTQVDRTQRGACVPGLRWVLR